MNTQKKAVDKSEYGKITTELGTKEATNIKTVTKAIFR